MSESMSSPWIRDYLMDIAETYGAQLYNAPVSQKKKRVQLTDLLTYQEDSYVWAWISDKDYRVSARISKEAVDRYKSTYRRSIVDSRFFLVFISSYRPMFSPRPLDSNVLGNTRVSHISLEISHVSSIGTGGHLFGNPRDLESDENMKEWVLGLRQDGGGGNVLKLRKQQDLVQNKKALSPPPPPPLSLLPASRHERTEVAEDVAKPRPERPQDFKRAYAKRWRKIEVDPWKFATQPAGEERPIQGTEIGHSPVERLLDAASQLESRGPLVCPTSPHRTPSPTSPERQGTPIDWSPSNRGSPVAPDEANTSAFENGIQQHDVREVLPITSHLSSDTEGHATVDTAITLETRSLQPPTPAQRIKRSPIRRSSSPPRTSPEPFVCSSTCPSQQLPRSSPPLPSPSLPLLSSSLPTPMGIRKSIQRKVPHPGLPLSRPDPIKQGPVQILVPNSDTSGTGSSQPYSQSQHVSQSQQYQPQLLSRSPAFSSSLAREFKPVDASTPREEKLVNTSTLMSKIFAESLPIHGNIDEQETTSADVEFTTEKADANMGKQGPGSNRPPAPSAPKIEVFEVGSSDIEEATDELQLTHSIVRTEVGLDTHAGIHDKGEGDADVNHEDGQLFVDKVQMHPTLQSSPPCQPLPLATASVIQHPSPIKQDTDGVSIHRSTQSSERPVSRSSMHSLFSEPLEDERAVSSHPPILSVDRTKDKVQEKAKSARVPRHDPEAWKEPSFIAKNKEKGKGRAVEELDIPGVKVGKKRRRSAQQESPVSKRAKVATPEMRRAASNQATTETLSHMQPQDNEASAAGKIHSNNRHSSFPTDTTETTTPSLAFQLSKPRLVNFVVDFERTDLGKGVPTPRLDLEKDMKSMLLRTGRIRTLGEKVEKDGSVYIMQ